MALPAGIETFTISYGPYLEFIGGAPADGSVEVTITTVIPAVNGVIPQITHQASGKVLLSRPYRLTLADASMEGTVELPCCDATGLNVNNWYYVLSVRLPRPASGDSYTPVPDKKFQIRKADVVQGAPPIDVDTLTDVVTVNGTVVAVPGVSSIAGLTGPVTLAQLQGLGLGGGGGAIADGSIGVAKLAFDVATQAELNAVAAAVPAAPSAATSTAQGIVELATVTEVRTGTDTVRAVTPAGVAAVMGDEVARGNATYQPKPSSGTASATTYLRGDGTWAAPAGGSGGLDQTAADARYAPQGDLRALLQFTPENYGAVGDGSTDDGPEINAMLTAASAAHGVAHFRPGTTYFTSVPIVAPGKSRVEGHGATIKASANTYDLFTLGTLGTASSGGYVKQLRVFGPGGDDYNTAAPTGYKAGIVVASMFHARVEDCETSISDIGFDLRGNCYGTKLIRPLTGNRVNVGLLLRGGAGLVAGSGSDIQINGYWGGGQKAAFWLEGNAGGYWFTDCKPGGGFTGYGAANDAYGVWTIGPTYEPQTTTTADVSAGATSIPVADGTKVFGGRVLIGTQEITVSSKSGNTLTVPASGTGSVSATITSGSGVQVVAGGVGSMSVQSGGIEGTQFIHAIRMYEDSSAVTFSDFSFNSNGSAGNNQMNQVLKHSRGGSPSISFRRCIIQGQWLGATPITITQSNNFAPQVHEEGTCNGSSAAKFNGTSMSMTDRSMMSWSGYTYGTAIARNRLLFGQTILTSNAGVPSFSSNNGASFNDLAVASLPVAAPPTVVQTAKGNVNSGNPTVTLGTAPTVGNLLVALVGLHALGVATPPAGWTTIDTVTSAASNNDGIATFWKVAAAGDTSTLFTMTAPDGYTSVVIYEISGAAGSPINAHAVTRSGGSNTATSPVVSPSAPGVLAIAAVTTDSATTATVPNGWVVDQTASPTFHSLAAAHRTATTTDSSQVNVVFTLSASQPWTTTTLAIAGTATAVAGSPYATKADLAAAAGAGAVTSVAGRTGAITLTAADVTGVATVTGVRTPALHGLLSWSYDPITSASTVPLVAGRQDAVKVPIQPGVPFGKVLYEVTTAAVGATDAYMLVYDKNGALLATSGSTPALYNAVGAFTWTLGTPITSSDTYVYVAFLVVGATTQPQLRSASSTNSVAAVNFGLTAGLVAISGATGLTTPTAVITPNAGGSNRLILVGLA